MTSERDKGRARQAKGSVREAIGKIIGNPEIQKEGRRESKAGAREAQAEDRSDPDRTDD